MTSGEIIMETYVCSVKMETYAYYAFKYKGREKIHVSQNSK